MFLAANNFFCRIDIKGDVMTRIDTWRDLGRPEAALVGVQYIGWNQMRYGSKPYILQLPTSRGLDLRRHGAEDGDRLLVRRHRDRQARTLLAARHCKVLATIPNVFGTGMTAEMSYYETKNGAKVFAAGAFSLGGAIDNAAGRAGRLERVDTAGTRGVETPHAPRRARGGTPFPRALFASAGLVGGDALDPRRQAGDRADVRQRPVAVDARTPRRFRCRSRRRGTACPSAR